MKKHLKQLTDKQRELVLDESISALIVSMLVNMPVYRIMQIRYRSNFKDAINEASKRYRAKLHKEEMEKFITPYGSARGWSREDEDTLLKLVHEGKSHVEIAQLLNRTMYSVARKYSRLKKEGRTYVERDTE